MFRSNYAWAANSQCWVGNPRRRCKWNGLTEEPIARSRRVDISAGGPFKPYVGLSGADLNLSFTRSQSHGARHGAPTIPPPPYTGDMKISPRSAPLRYAATAIFAVASVLAMTPRAQNAAADPWTAAQTAQPSQLTTALSKGAKPDHPPGRLSGSVQKQAHSRVHLCRTRLHPRGTGSAEARGSQAAKECGHLPLLRLLSDRQVSRIFVPHLRR